MPAPRGVTPAQPGAISHRLPSGAAVASSAASRRASAGAVSALARGLAAFLVASLAACAASHFDGQVFRKGGVAFRLEHLPPSWRRVEIDDTALAFRDEGNAATVAINGRCGKDAEDVPLQSLTQHLFLQFTERELTAQEVFPLDGREALRTEMVAKLDGVPKYFHVVVLKKDGCVYDFLQIANQQQDKDQFLDFVRGFTSLA
jgi:hypothetical protein